MSSYLHDPQSKLDYGFDWSDWLKNGETIITSTWAIAPGLTKISDSFSTSATTIWLKDGTAGESHTITNHVVTSQGREDDRSHVLKVKDR
jgi:hypothetical protein